MNQHTLLDNVMFDFSSLDSSICVIVFSKIVVNIICCLQIHNKIIGGLWPLEYSIFLTKRIM